MVRQFNSKITSSPRHSGLKADPKNTDKLPLWVTASEDPHVTCVWGDAVLVKGAEETVSQLFPPPWGPKAGEDRLPALSLFLSPPGLCKTDIQHLLYLMLVECGMCEYLNSIL